MAEQWQSYGPFVRILAGRWTLNVLGELVQQPRRYQGLHDVIVGISHKVLTDTLRPCERDGFIGRHLDRERVDTATVYELTDLGKSLDDPLGFLGRWFDANWELVEAAQRHWDQRTTTM